jgi:hypothetical protein
MKIRRVILIDGAATRHGGRKPGNALPTGSGTSAWNRASTFILIRDARPRVLLLSRLHHRPPPSSGSAPPEVDSAWKAGRFLGHDATLHPDGTLLCPANQERRVQEQRRDGDGSRRVVSGQHPQWSSLSAARAMPMAGEYDGETTSGECAAASAPGGSRTAVLARWEPQRAATRQHAAHATPT